ncbi:MAG: hemerythrin domain-containing protein [Aureispira sp.]|nr:hemerythrin domain-containing protein [Aureispira sp.]
MDNKKLNKVLSKTDPIKRNVEKKLEADELSPMDPPVAYGAEQNITDYAYEDYHKAIQQFIDEHKVALDFINDFENALTIFKANAYVHDEYTNGAFKAFFSFFDDNLLKHNEREEKALFPLLHKRLIEVGEHSNGTLNPTTAINLMEDDHVQFIQLGTLAFNLMGLASRILHPQSKTFILDVAYDNARELIELLKLHIYREDNRLFPLAQKFITEEEFEKIHVEMGKY